MQGFVRVSLNGVRQDVRYLETSRSSKALPHLPVTQMILRGTGALASTVSDVNNSQLQSQYPLRWLRVRLRGCIQHLAHPSYQRVRLEWLVDEGRSEERRVGKECRL